MFAILKKEIRSFFASPIGYLVIALFLLLNGLFLWVFPGDFNILDNGFADLSAFFLLAPWVLIFLIPAVTMRSFSDEKKQGTFELLLTKPISYLHLVLGKYLGVLILVFIAIIPTILYVYTVYKLGNPEGNLDLGSISGSYFGLLFLAAAYTAIGIFASSLSNNQIVAFITAVFLCFFFYIGFEGVSDFLTSAFVEKLGISYHFKSISRGVIDTRDIIYFLSLIVIFAAATVFKIKSEHTLHLKKQSIIYFIVGIILISLFSQNIYKRIDLTQDNRYTLSNATLELIEAAQSPIIIDVFLEGEFPSEFRRLQTETKQLLEEFSSYNKQIKFNFINPIEDDNSRNQNMEHLVNRGLEPLQLSVRENGKLSETLIFPWALASYREKTVAIPLIKNKIGASQQELVTNSVQNLEYAFANAFKKLLFPKAKKVAILKGNNELEDKYLADFLKTLREHYYIAPFTLDSVDTNPQKTLTDINAFDLIIAAKPTEAFTENEKYVLDQFTMNGGRSLWLLDAVTVTIDSLMATGKTFAIGHDFNLTDFFFKYGIRINPVLINDLYSAPITLATGQGSQAQFKQFPWFYTPLINTASNHPIVNNLNLIKFNYANAIDTLKNNIKKTILLHSSILSKTDGTPREINLSMATKKPDPQLYNKGLIPMAVLLEGAFSSVYQNRIKPFSLKNPVDKSPFTKMVIIADGDLIKNDVGRNGPEELGFDKWSGQLYGNKEFLLNTVNYLLDDTGLINIRSKVVTIPFLDHKKVSAGRMQWQILNLLLPLFFLGVFGWVFNRIRKKRYHI